ncbi:MAG TPA: OST-HTH/LOTUS domain-containing protein [Acidobacteriaceae bacterium]
MTTCYDPTSATTQYAQFIVRAVSNSSQNTISGSRLAVLLREAFPSYSADSLGCRNLRDFIRRCVPEIVEIQKRAGTDVIYTTKEIAAQVPPDQAKISSSPSPAAPAISVMGLLLNNPRAWKTFASPSSNFRIFLRPDASEIRVLPKQATPSDASWVRIEPISALTLLQAGKDFVDSLPDLYRPQLLRSLEETKWWIPYYDVLGSFGIKNKWVAFRRRRIVDEFQKAIANARAQKLIESRVENNLLADPTPEHIVALPVNLIRKLALSAVERMTDVELRSLPIPLGLLMDALNKH